jgi:hypothetical protein
MKRTTVFLDEPLLRRLKQKARAEGKSFARCVREAVAAYVAEPKGPRPLPSWVGMFKGGPPDNLSERVDEVVAEGMRKKFPQYFPPE